MKIYLGEKGLAKTWQDSFPKTVNCQDKKCKGTAHIAFVAYEEGGSDEAICNLHETTGKKGGLWFHDCISTAVYACQDCLEPTARMNQA